MTTALDTLKERGFIYQLTDEDATQELLANEPTVFYVGFDPTADSLHIGHLLPVMAARILQQAGHRPLILVGGGTAMIGDPSGKTEARRMLSDEQVRANADAIASQLSRFVDLDDTAGARMVNNADWLAPLNYIEFLRDVGKHFSINRMLTAESVRQRLETGLSFLEFNYMLLQAYDFYVLARDYGCAVQLGGQDQWGNIVAGVDLVRRLLGRPSYGITLPLLTDSAGKKFGKTEDGAVFLDTNRTAVFDYYQFWRNTDDTDVERLLALFTSLPMDEVQRLGALKAPRINRAKEILAYEATALAHGHHRAVEAFHAAGANFGFADPEGTIPTSSRLAGVACTVAEQSVPTHTVPAADLADGLWVVKLFADAGLGKSNGAVRRLIAGGGVYLNDQRVTDPDMQLTKADFPNGTAMLRVGKKQIRRAVIA